MVAKPLCPLYKNIIKPLDKAHYPELRSIYSKSASGSRSFLFLRSSRFTCMIWSSETPLSSKCLQKMLKRRKDLPHRRMPVIIFIIPLPSAEMSLSRYSLRSKYIISLKIFVSRHIFLQQKYTFYLITPNFFINLTL